MSEAVLKGALLGVEHGFFTRLGGVSPAPYDSLNCSLSSQDDPANVAENRARVARAIGIEPDHLMGLRQTHGDVTVCITAETKLWLAGTGQDGDALVTDRRDVGIGVITADCGPVLLASENGAIVGAAHAGWRGAVGGFWRPQWRLCASLALTEFGPSWDRASARRPMRSGRTCAMRF